MPLDARSASLDSGVLIRREVPQAAGPSDFTAYFREVQFACDLRHFAFGLTQAEVAERTGIAQAADAQREPVKRLRNATLEKVAAALGIASDQLRW